MDDADHALLLSAEANWNQTRLDWEFMIRAGSVRGLVAGGEHLVATAATLPFDRTFAWISMILVTERWRGRGLATRLMGDCLEQLRGEGIVPMLDATEAGREVYRRLGFSEIYALQRVEAFSENVSVPATREIDGEAIQALTPRELANIAVWDRERFGACRSQVLGGLLTRSREFACYSGDARDELNGFLLGRDGRTATQLGPVVATEWRIAQRLIAYALSRIAGRIFMDVPVDQTEIGRWVKSLGFVPQRGFTRMALGRDRPFDRANEIFAIAGPELG